MNGPKNLGRSRGLAGSGKTVVLAMKAALTSIREPEARIAFTFYTKSLYQHVKQLITRFYRLYDDRDPDWNRLKVLHAWGGGIAEGMYSYASTTFGETPLTFGQAKAFNPAQPFDYACKKLLNNSAIKPLFDYIFLDEAQDFPPSFLRLALKLAEEEKLVVAYDVLQTIFDVEIPTAEILFGTDEEGEPAVTFDEDVILHRCYRNPREVLVAAHAIGFGLYAPRVVQMLESKEHWEDFGYEVVAGELVSGSKVVINRPKDNSPSSISDHNSVDELIRCETFSSFANEIDFVVEDVAKEIKTEGVSPEDILVISVDDKNARNYFRYITAGLANLSIATNNHQDDSFALRDFQAKDKVTLSTVYKAKGNEAYIVYVVGVDALFARSNAKARNVIFTAMTRAKGWLRITGIGREAEAFSSELKLAKSKLPRLEFTYPKPEELIVMKRDLSVVDIDQVNDVLDQLALDMPEDELEEALVRRLRTLRARRSTRTRTKIIRRKRI